MKRLLRISLDIFISSLIPIISWFLIGLIIDKNLTNVFSLTYPLQCIMGILVSVFGVGANVCIYKDKNKNASNNGIFYGTIVSIIIYLLAFINCSKYIDFMNMDKNIYMILCKYSIIQILLQTILHLILTKLYYLEENKKANEISILFNFINFAILILVALITKDQLITSIITLFVLIIFIVILLFKYVGKIDLKLNIKNCLKYDSVSFTHSVLFFLIYLFGFSNSFAFGEDYVIAITFATLVTDLQWDIADAIQTVAKIDIVKNKFNYNYHFKNAMKLVGILIFSVLLMSICLYPVYRPNMVIITIFISWHIIDFMMVPPTVIKMRYLEIEYSSLKTTINNIIAYMIRTIICLLPTPFCTIIGQICSSTYELIYATIVYKNHNPNIKQIGENND